MGPGLRRGDGDLGGFLFLICEQRGEAAFGFGGAGGPGLAGGLRGFGDVALVGFVPVVPGLVGFVIGGIGAGALEVLFGFAGAAGEEAFARRVGEAGGGGGVLSCGEREEHVVEVLGEVVDGLRGLRGAGVEPGEMGEQQPRVKALALAHRLAPEPDRLGGAMERALGKDLLGRLARKDQRRRPPGGKARIAATADIGRLLRHPRHPRRHAHLPVAAEVFEEPRDADGGELVGVGERALMLPARQREDAALCLPSRKREGLGVGPSFFFPLPESHFAYRRMPTES